ncbi:MAG TPA: hypothetical protein VMR17_11985 [Xanthobacteraceae bacterium]|nr:hypothetical protein [Xanthobacteraceae bacterium]
MSRNGALAFNRSHIMPMRGELRIIAARPPIGATAAASAWSRFLAIISDRELQCVVAFCAIGLLLAIDLILLVPGYSETVAALQMAF